VNALCPDNPKSPTVPGTETNVTPDREVPIIPKATNTQFELRLPIKKESLVELREVTQATPNSIRKYARTNTKSRPEDISDRNFREGKHFEVLNL
jgi:hypothetical protein